MSSTPATLKIGPRLGVQHQTAPTELSRRARLFIRLAGFSALALYGALRWRALLTGAPTARLLGLFALAVAVVVLVPVARRVGRPAAVIVAIGLCLLALPVAGVPWQDFIHVRVAVSAREIGNGLSGLPNTLVPYEGGAPAIRLVIVLGAAVLLLDGAIVLAFASQELGDARRAGAALPLLALAVVPSTLVHPEFPYLQGLLLFALLAVFVWGERVRPDGTGLAFMLLAVTGVAGAIVGPQLDQHHPWVNYRAWAGTLARPAVESFDWNQRYGPLRWPHDGRVVMTVTAAHGNYWKAEDLDVFNGYAWVAGSVGSTPLPAPRNTAVARWSEAIRVQLDALRTDDVIASGYADQPSLVPSGVVPGAAAGTWLAAEPLGPGASYTDYIYSPHPSARALAHAGNDYPTADLAPYRTLGIPNSGLRTAVIEEVGFSPYRRGLAEPTPGPLGPYASAFALARRLAAGTSTPYGYVQAVMRYLDAHYTYNENPPARQYPLESFLFNDKIGYCQQFSGAMAMLLRMGGVPARVAAGFTSGARGAHDQWLVSDLDAHAWVEVWFPHYGWVQFDPTPASAPARGGGGGPPVLRDQTPRPNAVSSASRRNQGSSGSSSTAAHGKVSSGAGPWPVVLALVALAVVVLLVGLVWRRPRRLEDRLAELERALARTGRPLSPDMTLAGLEHRYRDAPAAAEYIRSLRLNRYGGSVTTPPPGGRRALREQLRHGLGLTGRLRALWALPPRLGNGLGRPGNP
jgi:transglutaminase-like putative cysteine protease